MTKSTYGCRWISHNEDYLVNVIGKIFETTKPSSLPPTLKYINALVQKLEMMGVDPGLHLCGAGMLYAAKISNYMALKKYLDIAVAKGRTEQAESVSALYREALTSIVACIKNRAPKLTSESENDPMTWRQDLLRLLTGWESGIPEEGEERKPCFALLVHDIDMYFIYVSALSDLHAEGALQYEFDHPETPIPVGGPKDKAMLLNRAVLSAGASIAANDPLHAVKVLHEYAQRSNNQTTTEVSEEKIPVILTGTGLDQNRWAPLRKALVMKYMVKENQELHLREDLQRLGLFSTKNLSYLVKILCIPFKSNAPVKWSNELDKGMVSAIRKLNSDSQPTKDSEG
jgi:hypothetical protein